MAQVKLLKVSGTNPALYTEFASTDDVTLASFSVSGGGPVLSSGGLDMNNTAVSDASQFAVTGGGPVLSSGLDMNTGSITDATAVSLTSGPSMSATGIDMNTTDISEVDNLQGVPIEDYMAVSIANSITDATKGIAFPVVTDVAGEVDVLRLPILDAAPSATPTLGEGALVLDTASDKLSYYSSGAWHQISDVAPSPSSVVLSLIAGETVSQGQIVYIKNADSKAWLADANLQSNIVGLVLVGGDADDTISVISLGYFDAGGSSIVPGGRYYLSETAGGIASSAPTTSGAFVIELGYGLSDHEVYIDPRFIIQRA